MVFAALFASAMLASFLSLPCWPDPTRASVLAVLSSCALSCGRGAIWGVLLDFAPRWVFYLRLGAEGLGGSPASPTPFHPEEAP